MECGRGLERNGESMHHTVVLVFLIFLNNNKVYATGVPQILMNQT